MEIRQYSIVKKENEFLYLHDFDHDSYYKVEYSPDEADWLELPTVEGKPFFNYVFTGQNPDMVIFGVPFKNGSRSPISTVDKFPNILRQASYKLEYENQYPVPIPINFFHIDSDRQIECGKLLDIGNVINDPSSERESIQQIVKFCIKNSLPFLCVGGDHSYTYDVAVALKALNKPIVIWVIDAHNDLYGTTHKLDHGNVFLHLSEPPFIRAIIQLGSRGYRTEKQIVDHPKVIKIPKASFSIHLIEKWQKEYEDCANYISIDLDSLDPLLFPFVDFGVPGGFTKNELILIIQKIFEGSAPVIGADLVEGTGGGNILKGDYDLPLEILISLLNHFYTKNKLKEGGRKNG